MGGSGFSGVSLVSGVSTLMTRNLGDRESREASPCLPWEVGRGSFRTGRNSTPQQRHAQARRWRVAFGRREVGGTGELDELPTDRVATLPTAGYHEEAMYFTPSGVRCQGNPDAGDPGFPSVLT